MQPPTGRISCSTNFRDGISGTDRQDDRKDNRSSQNIKPSDPKTTYLTPAKKESSTQPAAAVAGQTNKPIAIVNPFNIGNCINPPSVPISETLESGSVYPGGHLTSSHSEAAWATETGEFNRSGASPSSQQTSQQNRAPESNSTPSGSNEIHLKESNDIAKAQDREARKKLEEIMGTDIYKSWKGHSQILYGSAASRGWALHLEKPVNSILKWYNREENKDKVAKLLEGELKGTVEIKRLKQFHEMFVERQDMEFIIELCKAKDEGIFSTRLGAHNDIYVDWKAINLKFPLVEDDDLNEFTKIARNLCFYRMRDQPNFETALVTAINNKK